MWTTCRDGAEKRIRPLVDTFVIGVRHGSGTGNLAAGAASGGRQP